MRAPLLAVVWAAALLGVGACGSVTSTAHDGGGGAAGTHDGGGGTGGLHGDSSTGTDAPRDRATDAPRDLAAGQDHVSTTDAPRDRTSLPPMDANSDGIVTGGQCTGDTDCKQYGVGVGGCCGACIPATDPQPASVQCLLRCLTPIVSCSCVNHQCTGSTTLL